MNLLERIFRRKRLFYLEAQNKLLMDMNKNLVTGDRMQITLEEKRLALAALQDPHFKARVDTPTTKYIRTIRNNLREKLRAGITEAEKNERIEARRLAAERREKEVEE